jgi:hypothetical protein
MPPVFSIAALALTLAAGAVAAQTPARPAAPAHFDLPHAYAGYSQPEISQCASAGALRASCTVPAMTAGRYLILAQASATSTGANATQALAVIVNGQSCAALRSNPFTGKKSLPPLVCQVTLLTDEPIAINAAFEVANATPDPAGPHLVVRRLPWNGVIDARGGAVPPRPAAAAAPSKK